MRELGGRPRFGHEDLQGKAGGPVYRLNSWFSLVPAIACKDKKFLLWRHIHGV